MLNLSNVYKLIALCLLIGGSSLSAQKRFLYKERILLGNVGIAEGNNSAFLQNIQDSILFTAKLNSTLGIGSFVNYYEADKSHCTKFSTNSYNRINDKIVVYGLASYLNEQRKNAGGSSFLNPEIMPFDFIEKDKSTKGNSKVETYHLVGAMSYSMLPKFDMGLKIDYATTSFAKFKDMRNLNDILNLKANTGIALQFLKHNKIGLSYTYKRYIEGLMVMQEGDFTISHYALVNKGLFMGLMHLYGENGILSIDKKRPWVAIANTLGMQYYGKLGNIKLFVSCSYEKEKGHFGNKGNKSVMFYKHNRNTYSGQLKIVQTGKISHIFKAKAKCEELKNKEQLYSETTSSGGMTKVAYYGENEIFERNQTHLSLQYDCLWGNTFLQAPWHLMFAYEYNKRESSANYYPFYRKQIIDWHKVELGVTRLLQIKNTDFAVAFSTAFRGGDGGVLQDGNFLNSTISASPPDYLNQNLEIEKDYLTAQRCTPKIMLRAERNIKRNIRAFGELSGTYTKIFNTKMLKGNYKTIGLSVGVVF